MEGENRLLEYTHGDISRARVLEASLERLADGSAGDELQEMAKDVLSGRVDFREAMTSRFYDEAVAAQVGKFFSWYSEQTPEELEEHMERAREYLATQCEQPQ